MHPASFLEGCYSESLSVTLQPLSKLHPGDRLSLLPLSLLLPLLLPLARRRLLFLCDVFLCFLPFLCFPFFSFLCRLLPPPAALAAWTIRRASSTVRLPAAASPGLLSGWGGGGGGSRNADGAAEQGEHAGEHVQGKSTAQAKNHAWAYVRAPKQCSE